jgi:Fe-S cluster biogenesis protein NfuA
MKDEVEQVLGHFQPVFQAHGGGFDVEDVSDEGRVRIRLTGTCVLCLLQEKTAAGMEEALKNAVPGFTGIEVLW